MIMKMFMRAGLVEGVFARIIPLFHEAVADQDTKLSAMHAVFDTLGMACDIKDLSSMKLDKCFVGPQGVSPCCHM